MSYPNDYVMQKISISKEEKNTAKIYAKKKGMTLQGWLAQLVRDELSKGKGGSNGQERA